MPLTQCSNITQAGQRCHRKVKGRAPTCWQHQSNQMGGKLLGEGGTGCVYKPALECQYKLNSNAGQEGLLMKVMNPCQGYDPLDPEADEESSDYMFTEDEISKIIRTIDPESQYFIPLSGDYCSLKQSQSNLEQLDGCEGYKHSDHKRQFRGYFMKDGGRVLEDYVMKNLNQMDIQLALNWILHIAKALEILHSYRIFHNDAHWGNIVIDPVQKQPKFIDFGNTQIVPEGETYNQALKDYEKSDMTRFYSTVSGIYNANKIVFPKQSSVIATALVDVFKGTYETPKKVIEFLTPLVKV